MLALFAAMKLVKGVIKMLLLAMLLAAGAALAWGVKNNVDFKAFFHSAPAGAARWLEDKKHGLSHWFYGAGDAQRE